MSDLDLIPSDYRLRRKLGTKIRAFTTCYVVVAVLVAVSWGGLARSSSIREGHLLEIQDARDAERQGREALERLRAERSDLSHQVALLNGLRGGLSVKEIFLAIDEAMVPGIWFVDWQFRRAGEVVEKKPQAVQTGYFLVIPIDELESNERSWLISTHMEIRGRAIDHSSLAHFVEEMVERPEIANVQVIKTQTRDAGGARVVEFELAVIVREQA